MMFVRSKVEDVGDGMDEIVDFVQEEVEGGKSTRSVDDKSDRMDCGVEEEEEVVVVVAGIRIRRGHIVEDGIFLLAEQREEEDKDKDKDMDDNWGSDRDEEVVDDGMRLVEAMLAILAFACGYWTVQLGQVVVGFEV